MLYRNWFAELGKGGPGVIHCAAGKDRTGVGCALTLLALGVDEDAVFTDYEFTNKAMDVETRLPRIRASMERRAGRPLDREVLLPILGVRPDYLRAALATIAEKHGSVEGYLEQVLGVGPKERERLRENLAA
jgi:protein tyrosine/serine phosphatase